jgi:hypothetical protein
MSNRLNSEDTGLKAHRSRAWRLPCVAIGILVPTLVFAAPIAMQARSALYWLLGGQTLIVTVGEVGDTNEASLVSIEIRDAANVVRASVANRSLVLGRPVILATTLPAGPSLQLRANVTVTIPDTLEFHQPAVSMEVFDPKSLTIKTLPPCALPMDQMPSGSGGAEGNCGGWRLTSPTPGAD